MDKNNTTLEANEHTHTHTHTHEQLFFTRSFLAYDTYARVSGKHLNACMHVACMHVACMRARARVCVCVCVCVRERRKIGVTAWGEKCPFPSTGLKPVPQSGIHAHRASDYTTRAGTPCVSRNNELVGGCLKCTFRHSPTSSIVKPKHALLNTPTPVFYVCVCVCVCVCTPVLKLRQK